MLPTLSHTGDLVIISSLPVKSYIAALQHKARMKESTSANTSWWSWGGGANGIKRGDMVIAISPTDPTKTVCKRVIGFEGDILEVDPAQTRARRTAHAQRESNPNPEQTWASGDGIVPQSATQSFYGHDELIPVFPPTGRFDDAHVRVPKGTVWLAGDNMSNSTDSRAYGPVPLAMVRGKVLARVRVMVTSSVCVHVFRSMLIWSFYPWGS